MRIGKKLTLVFTGAIVQLALFLGLALWAMHSMTESRMRMESAARMMDLGDKIASDLDGIAARLSYIANSADGDPRSVNEVEEHRKEYRRCFEELNRLAVTNDAKAEIVRISEAVGTLREVNQRALGLENASKQIG